MRLFYLVLTLLASSAFAEEKPLTLEEALATADAAHPLMQSAQAYLDLALADQQLAASGNDATLTAEGALRRGKMTVSPDDVRDDNVGRLVFRKTLFDFGREQGQVDAARQEVNARRLALMDTQDARRIDIMGRFFDVLITDAQYGANNEFTAVFYVNWDDSKRRYELGEMSARDLAQKEATYQDQREKRYQSQLAQRTARQKLANAMNQPGKLSSVLAPPTLKQNDLPLMSYEQLLPVALQSNRKLLALQQQLAAIASRVEAIRAGRAPTVDMELLAGDYSRDSVTRDRYSGGLILNWPIYQGDRLDSRLARQLAERNRIEAEAEQYRRDLAENLLEIDWLRNAARPAAKVQIDYRDKALERARAEYELEMKSSLGGTLAETQMAAMRANRVEYRLALALARLEAMVGRPLAEISMQPKLAESK
jgi:outer membrane protein TolC